MYFVKMFDQVEKAAGFLSGNNEFDVRENAEEFETREEAEEALEEFLDTYSDYRDDYIAKVKKIS